MRASVKAMVAVRCISVPSAVQRPADGCMKLVFISMVTTPMSISTLRAAVAMVTSSSVMTAPPCVTLNEFRCSGRGS
jgi:hypothetical protein